METIGPGVEFSYIGIVFPYTADFFNNGLIISDTCNAKLAKCIAAAKLGGTYTLTFLDEQFNDDFIATDLTADGLGLFGFRGAAGFTVIGKVGVTGTTTFAIEPIPAPEPGSIFLLGTGMLATVTGIVRRRLPA